MTSFVPDHFRRLLSHYRFNTECEEGHEDLLCTVCNKLMIDAYQTFCGCQYCRECLLRHLNEGYRCCRGRKTHCEEEPLAIEVNAFRNAMINRRISKLTVKCPNESCSHRTEIANMEEHLRLCKEQLMRCPFQSIGCESDGSSQDKVVSHLHDDNLHHSQLLMEVVDNLKNDLGGLGGLRSELASVVKDESNIREVEAEAMKQGLLDKIEELRKEMLAGKEETRRKDATVADLVREMRVLRKEIAAVKEESKDAKKRVVTLEKEVKKYQDDTKAEIEVIKEETNKKASNEVVCKLNQLQTEVEGDSKQINILNERMKNLPAVGSFSFTINRFSERNAKEEIFTPYFYSHPNGYKLRLKVYPGGRGTSSTSYLSVSFVICKGEYDDLLSWPCMYTFNVSVINQQTDAKYRNVSYCYLTAADSDKVVFNKPTKDENKGYGRDTFISHQDLLSVEGLVVDDKVLIRCDVSDRRGSV